MFVLTLPDGSKHHFTKLTKLHAHLTTYLTEHGYVLTPSMTDVYGLSSPKTYKSPRLAAWSEVFQIEKCPHVRTYVVAPTAAPKSVVA